ncbi:hypothetical protein GUITHDRAFT_56483, partial [Guillardia theta CCMP2712]
VSCGCHHGLILCSDGSIWVWGSSERGQCGLKSREVVESPKQIEYAVGGNSIVNMQIKSVAAGDVHSLLLSAGGRIIAFGDNSWGQLGLPETQESEALEKERGELLQSLANISSSVSPHHTLLLSKHGRVYSCGLNQYGQLGLAGEDAAEKVFLPKLIRSVRNVRVIQASAGLEHSLFLTSDRTVLGCGRNEAGVLG